MPTFISAKAQSSKKAQRRPAATLAISVAALLGSFACPARAHDVPPAPRNLTALPASWTRDNDFAVSWQDPTHPRPIVAAWYKLDSEPTGPNDGIRVSPLPTPRRISYLTVAAPGEHVIWVWLEDSAGHRSQTESETATFRYDPDPPGPAVPEEHPGWISYNDLPFLQRWSVPDPLPASGLRGYATALLSEGEDPDPGTQVTDLPAREPSRFLNALNDGTYLFTVRAISKTNVAGPVAKTQLRVDSTPPETVVAEEPDDEWINRPLNISLTPTDETSGPAYVTYSLDGAPAQSVAQAAVSTAREGRHALTYFATDRAGNREDEQLLEVGIDRTPPRPYFKGQRDPSFPARIEVIARDLLSGLADGTISYRPRGSKKPYRALNTYVGQDRLVARFPSASLGRGVWELKATAADQAGNAAETTRREDGAPALLRTPLRPPYDLRVGFLTKRGTEAKGRRLSARRGRRGRPSRRGSSPRRDTPSPRLLKVKVASMGKRARIAGRLRYRKGRSLHAASQRKVQVLTRTDMDGTTWRRLKPATTDARGRFKLSVEATTSRRYLVRVSGDRRNRLTEALLRLRVRAKASLHVRPKRPRRGEALIVKGRIFKGGAEIPPEGKLYVLRYRFKRSRRWWPALVGRTDRSGAFRVRYRPPFRPRAGRLSFKVAVIREARWPFLTGASRVRRVRVRAG